MVKHYQLKTHKERNKKKRVTIDKRTLAGQVKKILWKNNAKFLPHRNNNSKKMQKKTYKNPKKIDYQNTICGNNRNNIKIQERQYNNFEGTEILRWFEDFMNSEFSTGNRTCTVEYLKTKFAVENPAYSMDFGRLMVAFLDKSKKFVRMVP